VTTQNLGVPLATPARPERPRKRGGSTPYLLVVPACVILVLALGYPLVWQLITSMQKFGL
jgi:N,N'-diacetylchitobiose transport system permease protein